MLHVLNGYEVKKIIALYGGDKNILCKKLMATNVFKQLNLMERELLLEMIQEEVLKK